MKWYEVAILRCGCQPASILKGRFGVGDEYRCAAHGSTEVDKVDGQNWHPLGLREDELTA